MKRVLMPALLSVVLFGGSTVAAQEIGVQYIVRPGTKADSNREIVDLLKQVIEKLEAQGRTQPGAYWQIETAQREAKPAVRIGIKPASVEFRSREAKRAERIGIKQPGWEYRAVLNPVIKPAAEPRRDALERRVDGLIRELEEIRRELKKSR